MKCPKCDYLGFETGDRCKNCGYDFSLALTDTIRTPDLLLHESDGVQDVRGQGKHPLEDRLELLPPPALSLVDRLAAMPLDSRSPQTAGEPSPQSASQAASPPLAAPLAAPPAQAGMRRAVAPATPSLPLFTRGHGESDEPLIKLPASPRPPLAVRRTPERPKLRTVPRAPRKTSIELSPDPVLAFADESVAPSVADPRRAATARPPEPKAPPISGAARRLLAAVVDLAILVSIDAVVIYFTFQIAGVPLSAWTSLPMLPLVLFLGLLKVSYFSVFTALGGQTVGKMATGIRVVTEDDGDVEPSQAVQRTLAALASVATVGIGFAPVLLGGDRRALHDRVAGTRVVGTFHE